MSAALPASQPASQASEFSAWIANAADGLDTGTEPASAVLPRLAAAGLTAVGVDDGDVVDGVAAISAVAEESLAAAFVLWGHRTYIEYLLQSPNGALRERLLPDLVAGKVAGATGLSNAMKFLAGLEALQIKVRQAGGALLLDGAMPWVTNLRPEGFHVAAVADQADGGALVVSFAHDDAGLERSADLSLLGMRSSNTAAVKLSGVRIGRDRILADAAAEWLPKVRPAFTGLQCGMSIGLARRSLHEAEQAAGSGRGVLAAPLAEIRQRLDRAESQLIAGLRARSFERDAVPLFELRIAFAEIVAEAVSLELQAAGGRAYLSEPGSAFARRWREAAFVPLITPSLVQLKTALAAHQRAAA